jgi:catechol 2,3-dioxygenase-like lactoylglutathione lyase family enzyme
MSVSAFGPVRQVAYLVEDLDGSVARWARFAGIGPWTIYRNVSMHGAYHGQATEILMDVALSYQDELQIELIRPHGGSVSPYQDGSGRILVGMHHIAWFTDDLERDKAKARERGMRIGFEAENAASKVAYFDSPDEPGLLFEFMLATPMLLEGFAQGVAASRTWDGQTAVLQDFDFAAA